MYGVNVKKYNPKNDSINEPPINMKNYKKINVRCVLVDIR